MLGRVVWVTVAHLLLSSNGLDVKDIVFQSVQQQHHPVGDVSYSSFKSDSPVVDTAGGAVRGVTQVSSRDGTRFYAFYGIPFAKPPIGKLRFKDPEPADGWDDILNATEETIECTNMLAPGKGSEDCLYLNVFTPTLQFSTEPKAVYVLLHGGAFIGGSSSTTIHNPDFYMDKDIILVTFNYRVGVLGFLSLQNEEVPGNAGLKDQRLALQWVRDNIADFGGDPKKVTVGGQSAGAGSAGFHLLSPSTKELFRGALLQSATSLTPWAYKRPDLAEASAFHLGLEVGCLEAVTEHNKTELLACLQDRPAELLVDLQELALTAEEISELQPFAFIPTTEPDVEGAFLTEPPRQILDSNRINSVPILIGSNSNEGLMVLPAFRALDKNNSITLAATQDMTKWVPNTFNLTQDNPLSPAVSEAVKSFYFNGQPATKERLVYLMTIVQFILQIQEFAKIMSEKSTQPVYNYFFTYDGPYAMNKPFNNLSDVEGVMHGDEIGYLSNVERVRPAYGNHTDRDSLPQRMIDRMTTMWTDFIKTGNPTPKKSEAVPVEWKPFQEPDFLFMEISDELTVSSCVLCQQMDFWNGIAELLGAGRPFPQPPDTGLKGRS